MRPCTEDADCEDRRTGEMCCLDLGRPLEWRWGKSSLVKKCCNNPNNVPVLAPQHNLSSQELRELDKGEYEQIGGRCVEVITAHGMLFFPRPSISESIFSGPSRL